MATIYITKDTEIDWGTQKNNENFWDFSGESRDFLDFRAD